MNSSKKGSQKKARKKHIADKRMTYGIVIFAEITRQMVPHDLSRRDRYSNRGEVVVTVGSRLKKRKEF